MRSIRQPPLVCLAAALMVTGMPLASTTRAEVTFQWAVVGDAGNAGDVQNNGTFGSVPYAYRISKYEVTVAQYTEFLNAKDPTGANTLELANPHLQHFLERTADGSKYSVRAGAENLPVQYVSWYDALRFANWLHNGQGNGDTESGAYTLLGGTPTPSNGASITRNFGATVFLTSENEWYKAAYYKGGGTNAGYWDYATQSDTVPISDDPPGTLAPTNSANYAITTYRGLTDVGAYVGSVGAYGTFDQTGNVEEWTESYIYGVDRILRGGSYADSIFGIPASSRNYDAPTDELGVIGFRIATIVPEPNGLALMCLGLPALLRRARRPLLSVTQKTEWKKRPVRLTAK